MASQDPTDFDHQLQEVLGDAGRDYWVPLMSASEGMHRGLGKFAHSLVNDPLEPGDTVERRVKTAMMIVFMAGRGHAERGYPSPFVRQQPVEEIDDDHAEMLEEMTPLDDPRSERDAGSADD